MDTLTMKELSKIRNETDAAYVAARAKAEIIAKVEFGRIIDETGDPFKAMEAYNQVMINLVGRP